MSPRPTPVRTAVTLEHATAAAVSGTVELAADDPMFTGHYPGFPVLPGAYLVELVDQTVRAGTQGELTLTELGRCRFRSPARPGDRLAIGCGLDDSGDLLRVRAEVEVRGEDRVVADLRMSYARTES
ncbi:MULTISPECIES: 3-hydroxyacyl-ACP dehydratase FabZ family protein [Amycolatopsis]|uniref:3-hydroxyacyl-ACP dehydratase FabZ family protein n=1 Tax=Amycolatopsis albidoflavus TaxID=102226 RepID=A0ABW5I8R3_9PSEU